MKVALVHDYLGEFGGAERVLEALCEIWPEAPIYTAFYRKGSAYERFGDRKIITSWAQKVPLFAKAGPPFLVQFQLLPAHCRKGLRLVIYNPPFAPGLFHIFP